MFRLGKSVKVKVSLHPFLSDDHSHLARPFKIQREPGPPRGQTLTPEAAPDPERPHRSRAPPPEATTGRATPVPPGEAPRDDDNNNNKPSHLGPTPLPLGACCSTPPPGEKPARAL